MIPTPKRSIITNKSLKHARHVLNCCQIVGGIKNIKKQPWSKVECFAFGGATVRFASLETSFHAATQSLRHPLTRAHHIAPRIKTARRFTAKNP